MKVRVLEATLLSSNEFDENDDLIKLRDIYWWSRSRWAIGTNPTVYCVCLFDPKLDLMNTTVHDHPWYNPGWGEVWVVPVLKLEHNQAVRVGGKLAYAGHIFTVLRNDMAICDTGLCQMGFRTEYDKTVPTENEKYHEDVTNYASSDVKAFVDGWFSKNGDEADIIYMT